MIASILFQFLSHFKTHNRLKRVFGEMCWLITPTSVLKLTVEISLPSTKLFEFLSWSSSVSQTSVLVFVSMMKISKLQSSSSSLWRKLVIVVIDVPATHQQLLLPAETDEELTKTAAIRHSKYCGQQLRHQQDWLL